MVTMVGLMVVGGLMMVVDLMAEVLMMEEDLIKGGHSVLEERRDSKKAASRYWDFCIKSQLGAKFTVYISNNISCKIF